MGWLALTALGVLLSAIIAWGILGRIPDQVEGQGILVSTGGQILDAMSPSEGTIVTMLVTQNSYVEKGQEIAGIEQASLKQEFQGAQETLAA